MRSTLFVVFAFFALISQTPTAAAQQPPQQQQEVLVPYAVCGGTTQSDLCSALAWVRQQQAAPPAVAVVPLGAPPSVVAVRPPPRCRSGHRGDECRCRNRGGLMQEGRCVSTRTVVAQVAGDTRDLTTRMTAAEHAIEELRTSQATTNRRVSETVAEIGCLEQIVLIDTRVRAGRETHAEARARELDGYYGANCGDLYRAAYNLPIQSTTRVATSPTPPPAPSRAAQANNAHAPNPTTPTAAEGPITVTFQ